MSFGASTEMLYNVSAVRCRWSTQSWLGLLLTLFMVLVLPSCWYGTLQRAIVASDIPANGNEEERDEHEQEQHKEEVDRRTSPPPQTAPAPIAHPPITSAAAPSRAVVASVAPPVHPSRFSVRRQQ